MPRSLTVLAALAAALALAFPGAAGGQSLPGYEPINPLVATRSGLHVRAVEPAGAGWRIGLDVDYASTIESNVAPGAALLLDSELLRATLRASRDVGPRTFVVADLPVGGAYDGVMDGFLNWYHDLLGFRMPERDARPENEFAYDLRLPDGRAISRDPADAFIGDLRLGAGRRLGPGRQVVVALTLPTSTAPTGYGRRTVSLAALGTVEFPLNARMAAQVGGGLGFTPGVGTLAVVQREWFASVSGGLRWRWWGRQTLYGNLFWHTAPYAGTTLPALDRNDLSFDFGWMLATEGGAWRIGMTEDVRPSGPGVDLVFRVGREWR